MANLYLAPDNVNHVMNQIQSQLPGAHIDLKALVNFMQQVSGQYPNNNGIDIRQYHDNLNKYTIDTMVNYIRQQGPGSSGNGEVSGEAQELGRLVDQLKRERNYNSTNQAGVPPVRNFSEPQQDSAF